MVSLRQRRPPERHDPVAQVLVQNAIARRQFAGHGAQVFVQEPDQVFGVHAFTDGGETLNIAEQQGLNPPRALLLQVVWIFHDVTDDGGVNILAEQAPDLFLFLQAPGHGIEGPGQLTDFVAGLVLHRVIVIAVQDFLGAPDQHPDRENDAVGQKQDNHQPEDQRRHAEGEDFPLQGHERGHGLVQAGNEQIAGGAAGSLEGAFESDVAFLFKDKGLIPAAPGGLEKGPA